MTVEKLLEIQSFANDLVSEYRVPAISLAVWHEGNLHAAATGVLNLETKVEATTDSVFQIGSITKVITASLVMKLVDEGWLDLDKPVKHYLRDFSIADPEATKSITVRQLLTHTSGIAGDFIPDNVDDNDNSIARYVDRCYCLPLIHPVGEFYSYSNAAYAIVGRLIEVLCGAPFCVVMDEKIFQPLGMTRAFSDPNESIRYRTAIGHLVDPEMDGGWVLTHTPYASAALAGAGTRTSMTATDLITFARAHMDKGVASSGDRWLSQHAVAQMQLPQTEIPVMSSCIGSSAGIGWSLSRHVESGLYFYSHLGGTIGQRSLLRVIPDKDLCIAALVNADHDGVIQAISQRLMSHFAGIDLSEPPPHIISLSRGKMASVEGNYRSIGDSYAVTLKPEGLIVNHYNNLHGRTQILSLDAITDDMFVGRNNDKLVVMKLKFLNPDSQGCYRYLYAGGRLHSRVS